MGRARGRERGRGGGADLRVATLFGCVGNSIEANVGEEHNAGRGDYGLEAVGGEGEPVGGSDLGGTHANDEQDYQHLGHKQTTETSEHPGGIEDGGWGMRVNLGPPQ